MERLTDKVRNFDGTASAKESLIDEKYHYPSDYCSKILTKLADYEDKQEQGLLIELPCKVGTVIYIVNRYWNAVEVGNICGFAECDDVDCFCYKVYVDPDTYIPVAVADFGVDWFLTEAEAEEALTKMGE